MKECMLSDFEKYCVKSLPTGYKVRIKYFLDTSFESVRVCYMPDLVELEDADGNYLIIHSIKGVYRDKNDSDTFAICSDYLGKVIVVKVTCLHNT